MSIAELAVSLGTPLPLGQDTPMTNGEIHVALYQGEPSPTKSLFGLDLPSTNYCIPDPRPLTKLDKRASYKVSFDGGFLTLSKVSNPSAQALKVPVGIGNYWRSFSVMQEGYDLPHASRLDCQALAVAVRQMVDVGVSPCVLKVEDGKLLVQASGWNCGIRADIGACSNAEGYGSIFVPVVIKSLLDASGPVFDTVLFGRDSPIILHGTLGQYSINALVQNQGAM